MRESFDDHVDACIEFLEAEDYRTFFAIRDVPDHDGTGTYIATGMDTSRLTYHQADLLQLVMLSRHLRELADIFDLPEYELLQIARHWDHEATDDLESLLAEHPHPIEDARRSKLRDGSDFRVDEELE